MTDRELAGCALRCPCTPDDPMAVFVSRCIEPMQMRGELYVVCCRWCGDNAPFVFVGRGASDLNRDAIAAWNRRAPSSEGDGRDAEIARLNAALRYEQHRADRIGTHGPRCETWGPAHYECLLREAEGLRRDAERLDWLCAVDPARRVERGMGFRAYEDVAPLDVEHSHWIALTDRFYDTAREAIDAAMEKERP